MDKRKQVYNKIAEMNLQEAVKKVFGRNFTQVSTANLEEFIAKNSKKKEAPKAPQSNKKPSACPKMKGTVESKFIKLVDILAKKRILLKSEVDTIAEA